MASFTYKTGMDVDKWLEGKEARDDKYRRDREDDRDYFEDLNRTNYRIKHSAGSSNPTLHEMKKIVLEVSKDAETGIEMYCEETDGSIFDSNDRK